MDDIQKALAEAWKRVRPVLERDPDELRRRLARRGLAVLQQPPRAWCLVVRAVDRRVDRYCLADPDPSCGHQVLLDSDALARLCGPVRIAWPGQTIEEVCELLGVTSKTLRSSRVRGVFRTHYIPAARRGWHGQQPLLYASEPLDPQALLFTSADPIWSVTSRNFPGRIPDGIEQTLRRVPYYHDRNRAYRDKSELHPEHPDVDGPGPRGRPLLRLPTPPPDPVWYKWKGDEFIGYDWRAAERNPRIRLAYEREQRRKAKSREAQRRRRREGRVIDRRRGKRAGSLEFRGWRWVCPGCGKKVRMLYYPLPRLHLLPGRMPPPPREEKAGAALGPLPCFACRACHQVRFPRGWHRHSWNEIVAYLSGGLLYGYEVERPKKMNTKRKVPYSPRANAAPAKLRMEVVEQLLAGRTMKQIARDLGLATRVIHQHACRAYKDHGVHCLRELLAKHGQPDRPRKGRLFLEARCVRAMAEAGANLLLRGVSSRA
jgi:hypothetical protein